MKKLWNKWNKIKRFFFGPSQKEKDAYTEEIQNSVQEIVQKYLNAKTFARFVADEFGYRAFVIVEAQSKVLVEIPEGNREIILDVILREWYEKNPEAEVSASGIPKLF